MTYQSPTTPATSFVYPNKLELGEGVDHNGITVGEWSNGFFHCCDDFIPNGLMAYCCPVISVAQITVRLGIARYSFILIAHVALYLLGLVAASAGNPLLLLLCALAEVLTTVSIACLRVKMRKLFSIPGNILQDTIAVVLCRPCAIAQMATHVDAYHVGRPDSYGVTPLIQAVETGNVAMVRLLLESGADFNKADEEGATPLACAAAGGYTEIVRFLLETGEDEHKASKYGNTPLMRAVMDGHMEVVKLLAAKETDLERANTFGCTALFIAAEYGHLEILKFLMERGAATDVTTNEGDSPLIFAALHGNVDVARFLLENGADIEETGENGNTALLIAAQNGHIDMLQLLLEKEADIDHKNQYGSTALLFAARSGRADAVKFLMDKGAAIDLPDDEGFTPLTLAAGDGHLNVVKLLLENGADIEGASDEGDTPLLYAASEGQAEVVRFLLEQGADIEKTDKENTRVVVKTVIVADEKERRTFHREVRIWQKARHPNIVPFFGACDEGSTYFFVCEEAKNGKLLDYLYHAREEGRSLVWRKLLDAALGLHFLHERRIVHSDLKCNQILVSKDGVAMLTDFGLSFLTTEQSGDEETVGAIRWKAPEVIRKDKPVAPNAQSDVYSFGMCVVEAVTSDVPWGQRVPDPGVKFHVTRQKFMPRPKAFVNDAQWELVLGLCAFDPSERMKLSDAIEMIRGFAEEEEWLQAMKEEVGDDLSDIGIG
ncbi:TKL protein kinase [Phytophthora cinnamomi]|uniref:TKL protein kinase n=1 Tax=Phytophthora cinnamomi TaxID=4785 RepID=UPI003559A38A|nr:TKL protein kinase [Phytophthora cinnamomi]